MVRSILIALVVLTRLALPALASDAVPEQSVTPIEAGTQQRVEQVGGAGEQQVQPVSMEQLQNVGTAEKGPIRRGAEAAGKVVLGVAALGISLGFTVASLLFF